MKICFICAEYPPGPHGGIGTMTQVMARMLVRHGHQVRVAGVYPRNYPAPDLEADAGVEVVRLRQPRMKYGWLYSRRRLYQRVASWVRLGEVDLIEVPDYQGWAAGWWRLPVPVVARVHGTLAYFAAELGQRTDRTSYWLESASLRRADFWCSVCKYAAERTMQLFRLRTSPDSILYNPVELPPASAPKGNQRNRNQVVFSGTLTPKKGIVSLVQSWPRVFESLPGAELHIYGKDGRNGNAGRNGNVKLNGNAACHGVAASMRESLLQSLPAAARGSVFFHGHVPREELFQAFTRAAVAVFPSFAEAFAIAPLESMACGCATIYSDRGSGCELIEPGRNGLLVDPSHTERISGAILRLLTDDDLRVRLGEAGRNTIRDRFSAERILQQNVDFYENCMNSFRFRAARAGLVGVRPAN